MNTAEAFTTGMECGVVYFNSEEASTKPFEKVGQQKASDAMTQANIPSHLAVKFYEGFFTGYNRAVDTLVEKMVIENRQLIESGL